MMPDGDVTIKAVFEKEETPDPEPTHKVTIGESENGTVTADKEDAKAGDTVTLTPTPDEGYEFKGWEVEPDNVVITDNSFVMPDGDVTIKAVFEKVNHVNPGGSTSDTPNNNAGSSTTETVGAQTGDNDSLTLWFTLLVSSAAGIIGAVVYNRRKRNVK